MRRQMWASPFNGPELDDLASEAASDALLAILSKLHQFRGESLFTTWAYRFVQCEVRSKIDRHFWQRRPVSLDQIDPDMLAGATEYEPQAMSEAIDLMTRVSVGIRSLTDRQQLVLISVALDQKAIEDVVLLTGSNRNALYKALFDARQRLRRVLERDGVLVSAKI
jgi:RNA polymerase sigma-70 factor, ECF subfamily